MRSFRFFQASFCLYVTRFDCCQFCRGVSKLRLGGVLGRRKILNERLGFVQTLAQRSDGVFERAVLFGLRSFKPRDYFFLIARTFLSATREFGCMLRL